MTRSITDLEYGLFVNRFSTWLGATVVGRDGVLEMETAAILLDLIGVADRDDFLKHTATTLGTVVYLPDAWDNDKKTDVLVHEAEHVLQYAPLPDVPFGPALDATQRALLDTAGSFSPTIRDLLKRMHVDESRVRPHGLGFAWLYLAHSEERAVFEAHAYCTGMEWHKRRYGVLRPLEQLANRLQHGYAIDWEDVATAKRIFEVRRTEVALGVYRSTVARKAAEILHGVSPELVASHP